MRVYIRRVLPLNGGNNRNKTGFLFTISMIYKAPGILTEPKHFIYELSKAVENLLFSGNDSPLIKQEIDEPDHTFSIKAGGLSREKYTAACL